MPHNSPMGQGVRQAGEAFAKLDLPRNLTLATIISFTEERRGRPISIRSLDSLTGTGTCGLWLSTDEAEFVFHAPTRSQLHRQQFILHEISHMLLDHQSSTAQHQQQAAAEMIFPDLDPSTVKRALMRRDFCTSQESAAEHMADLLAAALRRSHGQKLNFERLFG